MRPTGDEFRFLEAPLAREAGGEPENKSAFKIESLFIKLDKNVDITDYSYQKRIEIKNGHSVS